MRKLLKSAKAISPVVAAIILIAVTVAVSIAVAAWMGALAFTFMGGAEELKITGHHTWNVTTNIVTLNVTNSGTGKLTISAVEVGGSPETHTIAWESGTSDDILDPGEKAAIEVTATEFKAGVKYEFAVITTAGNRFTYIARAPS